MSPARDVARRPFEHRYEYVYSYAIRVIQRAPTALKWSIRRKPGTLRYGSLSISLSIYMSMPVPHPGLLLWVNLLHWVNQKQIQYSYSYSIRYGTAYVSLQYQEGQYCTVFADSDTSTVRYGLAAHRRVSVQNFTARIRNCTESNGHADRMTDSTFRKSVSKTYKNVQYGTRYGF